MISDEITLAQKVIPRRIIQINSEDLITRFCSSSSILTLKKSNPTSDMKVIKKSEKVDLKPKEVDADSAYGFIETFKNAESLEIELNAPFRGLSEKELSVYELKYDSQTHSVTCLNGINVKLKGKDKLLAEFPIRTCRTCPKKDQCPISNSKRIKFHKDHEVARRAIERI